MLTTSAEVHRLLWYGNGLAVGQAFGGSRRDRVLFETLAASLGIPDERFITSEEGKSVSAQRYLTAFLETMEPLAEMFHDVWVYCQKSATTTSADGQELRWEFTVAGEKLRIDFEAFRKYRTLRDRLPDERLYNELANAFATATRQMHANVPSTWAPDWMPPSSPGADPRSVVSRIHALTSAIAPERLLGQSRYHGFADARPKLFALTNYPHLWHRPHFDELAVLLENCEAGAIRAEDILALPFWKFRWQMYELWCLVTTMQLFEERGFRLCQSTDGSSVLELGAAVTVSVKRTRPVGRLVYQPGYLNTDREPVKPDVAVMSVIEDDETPIDPRHVMAIVECKQRAEPEQDALKRRRREHFEEVARKYSHALAPDGVLAILNYDSVDFPCPPGADVHLLGNFMPASGQAPGNRLAHVLDRVLEKFSDIAIERRVVLVVDGSASMARHRLRLEVALRDFERRGDLEPSIFWAAGGDVVQWDPEDVSEATCVGGESEDLFRRAITEALGRFPNAAVHVVTDLEPSNEMFASLRRSSPDLEFIVRRVG